MAFLRQVALNIFVGDRLYKTFLSDGTRNTVQISFDVQKTSCGQPNQSSIVLYNVSSETKQTLLACTNKTKITISLFVGYLDEGLTLISTGDLIKMWPEKQGTTSTFTLTYLDGFQAIQNSFWNKQYNPSTEIKDIILELAQSFLPWGVVVDKTKIHVEGVVGTRGYTVQGRTATSLDLLANSYGFTWSIQDSVFQAYMDNGPKKGSQKIYPVSLLLKNLIKATPELGEKYMQQTGMKIEAILNPKCKCLDLIQLTSAIYPQYSGLYEIHNIQFVGDTGGADWKMSIDSKTIV